MPATKPADKPITTDTLISEIRAIHAELVNGNKFAQNLATAVKPKMTEMSDFFNFVAKGWANPSEAMNSVISDLHATLTHLAQAAALQADVTDPNNSGGRA